jgi:hypothetical protein
MAGERDDWQWYVRKSDADMEYGLMDFLED